MRTQAGLWFDGIHLNSCNVVSLLHVDDRVWAVVVTTVSRGPVHNRFRLTLEPGPREVLQSLCIAWGNSGEVLEQSDA